MFTVFTVGDVAKRLHCSPSTIYALCEKGHLGHLRIGLGRGAIRISEEQLEEYVKSQTKASSSPRLALKHIQLPSPANAVD